MGSPFGLGVLARIGKRPGAKANSCLALFRSLKATAPSVSLTLKRQGTRFAPLDDTP